MGAGDRPVLKVRCGRSAGRAKRCGHVLAVVVPTGTGLRLAEGFVYTRSGPDAWPMGDPVEQPSLDVTGSVEFGCPGHANVAVERRDVRLQALKGRAGHPATMWVEPTGY